MKPGFLNSNKGNSLREPAIFLQNENLDKSRSPASRYCSDEYADNRENKKDRSSPNEDTAIQERAVLRR
jgi:hypothetical protein